MKVRGRRRRTRAQVQALQGINWDEVQVGIGRAINHFGVMAATVLDAITAAAESVARVGEAWVAQWHEYLGSERYQLDLIAVKYKGDPMGHSAAVGEFFTARAHRELDDLAERIQFDRVGIHPWQRDFLKQLFRKEFAHQEPGELMSRFAGMGLGQLTWSQRRARVLSRISPPRT